MRTSIIVGFTVAVLLFSSPAYVHHSGAMFDITKVIKITGTIAEFNWSNPHANFKVVVVGADGVAQSWAVEMNSPNNLVRDGWKRTTLNPGDKVTVTVHPLRDGSPGGQYVSIVLSDGRALGGEQQR